MTKQSPRPTQSDAEMVGTKARSRAEWISFGITSFVLCVIVGLVSYLWLSERNNNPPDLRLFNEEKIRQSAGQFYVPFSVTNEGGKTAAAVQVIAELHTDGEVIETGEQRIDFLSSGEVEEGAFVFTRDPRAGKLVLRVASYKLP